jgi:dipeptidyl aminopeptidase/acylaminoacyl peptidase
MTKLPKIVFLLIVGLLFQSLALAQGYQKPPQNVVDVLNAPATPATSISPARDKILLLESFRYPPISELAQPMLRLAGLRINPNTNAQHRQPYAVKMTLRNIADGRETAIQLPANAQIISPQWSADGRYIAAGNAVANGIELWIIETATGKAQKIRNAMVNTAFGGYSWMPDQRSLLVNLVPTKRAAAPSYRDITPNEPNIQETTGRAGAVQTFQDLLRSPNDERLFEYFMTSQLAIIGVDGKIREIGQPAIFDDNNVSPDGRYILVSRIQRPFSYLYPASRFPKEFEVWDTSGKMVHKLGSIPLQDQIPVQGVTIAPRSFGWHPVEPATLIWVRALDNGDPRSNVTPRDNVLSLKAPFNGQPTEIVKTEHRYQGRSFGERDGLMLYYDFNPNTRRRRIFAMNFNNPSQAPKLISDLNVADRYKDIGTPVFKRLPNGFNVIHQNGSDIFLTGSGASPEGDRPFLRRYNLQTGQTQELFRSGNTEFESFVVLMDDGGTRFLTRKESPLDPPNLFLRTAGQAQAAQRLTNFPDPAPSLRGIKKQLVTYKRADGVDLSFTLYLPPNYKEGTRLPTVIWAYPLEFTDADVAGQVSGSTNRFTQIGSTSHLFFLLQGYAVLDNTTMPVVGNPETVNDTFVKQIVDSAKAAIDKGVEMGVVDPDRVGVGGHSYGAFMTANLLAHSDLFRAGIARSGAYNRTLTPFGFQSERRTFWEARELYQNVSPFFFANKINEPILLIHGEADNNQGTFPMQSERLFAAIRGNGGTARLVMLPLESHGYAAKESVEHTLYEMINWFDKYVKNAPPRDTKQVGGK